MLFAQRKGARRKSYCVCLEGSVLMVQNANWVEIFISCIMVNMK
jgi:hypothetical protein